MKLSLRGLTTDEVNVIIAALGRCPHDDVFHLLQRIHAQVGSQIAVHNRRAEAKPAPPPGEKL